MIVVELARVRILCVFQGLANLVTRQTVPISIGSIAQTLAAPIKRRSSGRVDRVRDASLALLYLLGIRFAWTVCGQSCTCLVRIHMKP